MTIEGSHEFYPTNESSGRYIRSCPRLSVGTQEVETNVKTERTNLSLSDKAPVTRPRVALSTRCFFTRVLIKVSSVSITECPGFNLRSHKGKQVRSLEHTVIVTCLPILLFERTTSIVFGIKPLITTSFRFVKR